jgi:hypothetical protein
MYLTKVILIYLSATWSTSEPFYTLPGALDRNRIIPALNGNDLIFLVITLHRFRLHLYLNCLQECR